MLRSRIGLWNQVRHAKCQGHEADVAADGVRATMAELERHAITRTLDAVEGSTAGAAEILDVGMPARVDRGGPGMPNAECGARADARAADAAMGCAGGLSGRGTVLARIGAHLPPGKHVDERTLARTTDRYLGSDVPLASEP